MTKRWLATVSAAAALLFSVALVNAPAASAEGQCQGPLSGGYRAGDKLPCEAPQPYFWHDNAEDAQVTALHLVNCNGNPDIKLMSTRGTDYGTKRFYCLNTDGGWQVWGLMPRGDYYFEVVAPRSTTGSLIAGYYHVGW
jgi:hypothetical protein